MADTVAAGGLTYKLDADTSSFTSAMQKAQTQSKEAGEAMGRSFDEASKKSSASIESFINKTVAAIQKLQAIDKQLGTLWATGSEGAEKSVTDAFDNIFKKMESGVAGLAARIPGVWGKVAAAVVTVLQGSGAFDEGFNWLKKKTADWLDGVLGSFELAKDRIKGTVADFGKSVASVGQNLGLLDEAGLKKSQAAIDAWADTVQGKVDGLVDGTRTALQKIAGTFKGVSDEVQKAIDELSKRTDRQEQSNELIGKSPGEQAALRAKADLLEKLGKEWDDLNAKEQEAAQTAIDHAKAIAEQGEAARKAQQAIRENQQIERQAAHEAEAFADHYDRQIKLTTESLTHRAETYKFEIDAIGQTAGAVARLRAEEQLRHEAERNNLPVTDAMLAQVNAIGEAAQKVAELKDAYNSLESVGKAVASSLESAFSRFIQKGQVDWRQAIQGMIGDLEKLAFRAALLPVFGGGQANPGGLFGNIVTAGLGLFGGGRAEGGPIEQGRWYIAGERGPEPIWGGGPGAFAAGYGGGSAGGGGGRSDITMNINLAGANGDQTIAQISSQAARQAYQAAVEANRSQFAANQRSARLMMG